MFLKGVLRHAEIPRDINKWENADFKMFGSQFLEEKQIYF